MHSLLPKRLQAEQNQSTRLENARSTMFVGLGLEVVGILPLVVTVWGLVVGLGDGAKGRENLGRMSLIFASISLANPIAWEME